MHHLLLMPFALVQGLWLQQRAPRLPVPDGVSGHFGTGADAPLRVVGLGDSVMAGTGVREQRCSLTASFARLLHARSGQDVAWRVHGRNGATSGDVLRDIAPAVSAADVYLISCGVNDATHRLGPAQFAENLARLLALLRGRSPSATIFYGGLPPLRSFPALPWPLNDVLARRVAALQRTAAAVLDGRERTHCFHFPSVMTRDHFASDGFHPGESACEQWARGLLELWPGGQASTGRGEMLAVVEPRRDDPGQGH